MFYNIKLHSILVASQCHPSSLSHTGAQCIPLLSWLAGPRRVTNAAGGSRGHEQENRVLYCSPSHSSIGVEAIHSSLQPDGSFGAVAGRVTRGERWADSWSFLIPQPSGSVTICKKPWESKNLKKLARGLDRQEQWKVPKSVCGGGQHRTPNHSPFPMRLCPLPVTHPYSW